MNWTITCHRMRAVAVAGTLGLALMTVSTSADAGNGKAVKARSAQSSAHKSGPRGDYSRHSEVRRTDNGHTRSDTWTGSRGTATRDATVVNDRENKTRTRQVDWTGPDGQQATRTDVTQRTESGYTRNSTVTGPQGGTTTRDATVVNDRENKTSTRQVDWTGPDGQQATRTDVTQRTESGYTRNSTATGPQGGTATREVSATRDAESGSWTKDVTVDRTPPPAPTGAD